MFNIWKKDSTPKRTDILRDYKKTGRYEHEGTEYGPADERSAGGYIFCNGCGEVIEHCECKRDKDCLLVFVKK